jgi:Ca2+/Na+ antiporter
VAGNIIGSNLFNIILIGGSVSLVRPLGFSTQLFNLEVPAMFGLTALIWLMMRRRDRWAVLRAGCFF